MVLYTFFQLQERPRSRETPLALTMRQVDKSDISGCSALQSTIESDNTDWIEKSTRKSAVV